MKNTDNEDMNPALKPVEIGNTARKIFDGILDEPMKSLKEQLEFIKENKFGHVWEDDDDRHKKVMRDVNTFILAITTSFSSKHAEAAKHIECSTCDSFLQYLHEKLNESLLSQHPFEDSWEEARDLIGTKISRIKDRLEAQHDEQPKQQSDLEVMISDTELLDPIHIHHALLCCQIARDCEDPECAKYSLENLEKEHLLTELSVSYKSENVPKYVMARCGNVLYVSFQAVQSHNFGSTEKSYRGEICTGIINTAKKIPLKYFAREILQNKRIVFSGHSSGGAVASLVLTFLLEKFKNQEEKFLQSHFKCITFGLMPLADTMLKTYVEAIPGAQDCFCHIVQKNDIVPKLFGSCNMMFLQSLLWELVENILKPALKITSKVGDSAFAKVTGLFQRIVENKEMLDGVRYAVGFDHLDIFGIYYILDTTKRGRKYSVKSPKQATNILQIEAKSLRKLYSQYLVNHKLERYVHEVELALINELPDMEKFKTISSVEMVQDITPKITKVLFENIGEVVIAKIAGSNMWFVHNVSITGLIGAKGKDLRVDVTKSSESEVQTPMPKKNFHIKKTVCVRVKTHFQNSKYIPPLTVPAKESTYTVTRRQQQLAKLSPREVIELAFLSAVLEHRSETHESKRFKAIKTFFDSAVSAVPLESIFHAMVNGEHEVVLQCCEIICSSHALQTLPRRSLDSLSLSMTDALHHIRTDLPLELAKLQVQRTGSEHSSPASVRGSDPIDNEMYKMYYYLKHSEDTKLKLLEKAGHCIEKLLKKCNTNSQHFLCEIDLQVVYSSANDKDKRQRIPKEKCSCKPPMALLTQGREELNQLSKDSIDEKSESTTGKKSANTNIKMLSVLTNLRKEFKTCGTLLGAFMESQVQIPLEKAGGEKYVNKLAKHARSLGLSVWGLLVLPFQYLNRGIIKTLSEEFQKFVVEFSLRKIPSGMRKYLSSEHQFPDYDERLEFLVASMKKSVTCNEGYISYSLERQLEEQCRKRHIFHNTSVDEILKQWNANFEDETLTLVPNEYRRLVARWIKWSLMINHLRESLASQTAIGVIGLVNSGKSKFVRSLFGKKTITGTTDQKRTTVPLIYNVGHSIKGMDVIDFPGVDDRDESIPDLAKLLLSLTRIIVFVVDYRRAHTQSTKQWLSILDEENVPVLICLTFADKLFAELMGENGDCDIKKVKLRVEEQLKTIKEQIGQPESGHQRDLKLSVFSFDNDSNLNTDEGKEKLRQVGLKDELDVGRWIAEKLQDDDQNDVSQNVITFIEGKEESTLNSNREITGQPPAAKKKRSDKEKRLTKERASSSREEQPTCSKNYRPP